MVPEFEFEEGHEKNKNDAAPVFHVGAARNVRQSALQTPEGSSTIVKCSIWWSSVLLCEVAFLVDHRHSAARASALGLDALYRMVLLRDSRKPSEASTQEMMNPSNNDYWVRASRRSRRTVARTYAYAFAFTDADTDAGTDADADTYTC